MQTRSATDARAQLAELRIASNTVLTGSTTITIDLAAFDALVDRVPYGTGSCAGWPDATCVCEHKVVPQPRPDCPIHGVAANDARGRDGLTRTQRGPTS